MIERLLPHVRILAVLAALHGCEVPKEGRRPGTPPEAGEFPLHYSIGEFDSRFAITREQFLTAAGLAEAVWEKAAGRELFTYEQDAPFRLSLVFDARQERTNEARKVKAAIDSRGSSYDALVWQHERRLERMKESEARYTSGAAALQRRLDAYNADVTSWNEKGGAPPDVARRLEAELGTIKEGEADLERMRTDYQDDVSAVNDLVERINEIAAKNNIEVDYFNGKFVESREFEQGVYDGRGITIYQFEGLPELRLALVHEFGHAMGFDHVEDPGAIMYYKMGKQDPAKPALAPADLALLKKKFPGQ